MTMLPGKQLSVGSCRCRPNEHKHRPYCLAFIPSHQPPFPRRRPGSPGDVGAVEGVEQRLQHIGEWGLEILLQGNHQHRSENLSVIAAVAEVATVEAAIATSVTATAATAANSSKQQQTAANSSSDNTSDNRRRSSRSSSSSSSSSGGSNKRVQQRNGQNQMPCAFLTIPKTRT